MKTLKEKTGKVKIGTIIDADILRLLKERAAREGRTIYGLIEEAVLKAEQQESMDLEMRLKSLERLLSMRFDISDSDWKAIMEEDYYAQ
jgi:hypothetical protein